MLMENKTVWVLETEINMGEAQPHIIKGHIEGSSSLGFDMGPLSIGKF